MITHLCSSCWEGRGSGRDTVGYARICKDTQIRRIRKDTQTRSSTPELLRAQYRPKSQCVGSTRVPLPCAYTPERVPRTLDDRPQHRWRSQLLHWVHPAASCSCPSRQRAARGHEGLMYFKISIMYMPVFTIATTFFFFFRLRYTRRYTLGCTRRYTLRCTPGCGRK